MGQKYVGGWFDKKNLDISEISIESVQKSVSSEVKDMEDSWGLII